MQRSKVLAKRFVCRYLTILKCVLSYHTHFDVVLLQNTTAAGRFWSVDQQANLYPADISVDSPWKQETGSSQMDPEMERSTQEAIDLYFSQHHTITSPEDSQPGHPRPSTQTSSGNLPMDMGSPVLPSRRNSSDSKLPGNTLIFHLMITFTALSSICLVLSLLASTTAAANFLSNSSYVGGRRSTLAPRSKRVKTAVTQWTQTDLSLPPVLPDEVTQVLQSYMIFNAVQQDDQPKVVIEVQEQETTHSASNSANSSVAPVGTSSG